MLCINYMILNYNKHVTFSIIDLVMLLIPYFLIEHYIKDLKPNSYFLNNL